MVDVLGLRFDCGFGLQAWRPTQKKVNLGYNLRTKDPGTPRILCKWIISDDGMTDRKYLAYCSKVMAAS